MGRMQLWVVFPLPWRARDSYGPAIKTRLQLFPSPGAIQCATGRISEGLAEKPTGDRDGEPLT